VKKKIRTFVAVEIDRPIRNRASELIGLLRGTEADVAWVEPQNLHLTLKFLGNVHEQEIFQVCRAVQRGADEIPPFDLEVCGAGAFPNAARPRTVWLGARDGVKQMIALHDAIENSLADLGYREEHRQFQTHLTLGRVHGAGPTIADLGKLLQQHAEFFAGCMTVNRVTVFSSDLTPEGPIYESIGVANLRG
jgi:2'-5' RNA ligase